MTSPQKRKGDTFERSIVDYLRTQGYNVDRTRAGWADDRGDIHGINGFTIECKNHRTLTLPQWIRELLAECSNAGNDLGAVVHKRTGTTEPGEQYATLPLWMLVRLLRKAGYQ